jgi:RimJ/RimL family protein N-acetyltransferase
MVGRFQSERALRHQIGEEGYVYYFFTVDGQRVGYFGICLQKDKTMFLSKIYMKKDYRGNGYASQGFAFIQQQAREAGCSKIWLTVNRYNEDSIAVYEHWGMKQTGVRTTEIGHGFIMDDYVYSYALQ